MMCLGCKDEISNVRLASADAIISFLKSNADVGTFDNEIRSHMEELSRDVDEDVKYLSIVALGC
eukprot:TRINITY_DN3695_c0_g1_i1.p1 TRINITY_DN3695_c0_g1~~TRINITY_DN3695_c0_g1_i1.p1  ORF type:complete len:64 (-),score=6.25 TRINITY_DN3695_c0_g1_i1:63-254(-)